MKIVIVSGSIRPNNFTAKTLALVLDEFKSFPEAAIHYIDPSAIPEQFSPHRIEQSATHFHKAISQAAGVILSTPEYHGSYSSTIKLIIDNLGYPSALSGKPVVLIGVASGQIGAIKSLEHLRSVCSHVGAIVLPQAVSVALVDKIFDEQGRCLDSKMEKRIRSAASILVDYIKRQSHPKTTMEETVRDGQA